MSIEAISPSQLLELARTAATKAGDFVNKRPDSFDLNIKTSVRDFATQMDIAAEKMIVETILAARPDDGIIGEEGGTRESKSGYTWVIDPIDGTVNYFYGMHGWNVSVAVKDRDGVVAGVVYAPTINSTWYATRGGGAFHNGKKIECNNPVELSDALIGSGFSYDQEKRTEQGKFIGTLLPQCRDLRRHGAAAIDLSMVASGMLDGYFEYGLNEWDLAAGGLIAHEAGALVTGRLGTPAGKEMTIAAGPHLHAQLLAVIG